MRRDEIIEKARALRLTYATQAHIVLAFKAQSYAPLHIRPIDNHQEYHGRHAQSGAQPSTSPLPSELLVKTELEQEVILEKNPELHIGHRQLI